MNRLRVKDFPKLEPPAGGVEQLFAKIDRSTDSALDRRLFGLEGSLVMAIAAACLITFIMRPKKHLQEIIAASNDIVVFKYGYKKLPQEQVQLLDGAGRFLAGKRDIGNDLK